MDWPTAGLMSSACIRDGDGEVARAACVQESAAQVPHEEATHPGEWPGIYACDARNLLDIYELTARARLAALDGDLGKAQVPQRRDSNQPELLVVLV